MKQCLQIFPQGRVVQKGVNFDLGLKNNFGFNFTCRRARIRSKFLLGFISNDSKLIGKIIKIFCKAFKLIKKITQSRVR